MEGPRPGRRRGRGQPVSDDLSSGKGHRDENFPVASWLIAARHRPAVMAFYRVARMADDISDHPTAPPEVKLSRLSAIEATLRGDGDAIKVAVDLREMTAARNVSPQHMLDLLEAFRRDVRKNRYADWAELMDYCRYSAAPVGRFVLEVHGESEARWPASDALCAALQVNNHLQDCGKDLRQLNRVYVPTEALANAGIDVEALRADRANPQLLRVIAGLAGRALALLETGAALASETSDRRLAVEIAIIHALAVDIARCLEHRDPLSERVHLRKSEMAALSAKAALQLVLANRGSANRRAGAIGAS